MDLTPPGTGLARISVTEPISRALDWTRHVLFEPFDLRKWFVLGFCAWLAWLGEALRGGSSWSVPSDDAREDLETAASWVQDHVTLVIALAFVGLTLIIGLVVLFAWLSSRGKLMFLDGVVRDRAAVVEPWDRFRELGNSLFRFRLVLGLVFVAVFGTLALLLMLQLATLGLFDGRDFGPGAMLTLSAWLGAICITVLVAVLIGMAVNDLVVPIMWLRGSRVLAAWSEAWGLLSRRPGVFVLYALMKLLLAILVVLITCTVTCVTCCIAAIPYIGTVILLPLFVFGRSYSIYFLSQFGPDYAALAPAMPPAAPPASGPPAAAPEEEEEGPALR